MSDLDWHFGSDDATEEILNLLGNGREPKPYTPREVDPEVEARNREREELGPVGFEQKHDWDRPGDVQYGHSSIEWVPTAELKKFMEYDRRPGGKDAWSTQERWDGLGQHIKDNGFKNPVMLYYDPVAETAHMAEGNHRTQIALDHGIPSMPVRVWRDSYQHPRNSPTAIPVKLQPEDTWKDHRGELHIPDSLKPSHIGLPVVPAPGSDHYGRVSAQYMYHVAPTRHRDSIVEKGLLGHLGYGDEGVQSPWQQNVGQPPGNYLHDSLPTAMIYAGMLGQKESPVQFMYPGDISMEHYYNHHILPDGKGKPEAWVMTPTPDDFDSWPRAQKMEWLDEHENDSIPYNHHDPKHRALLPENLQGHDIWKVNVSGLPLSTDPEEHLVMKQRNEDWSALDDWDVGGHPHLSEQRWVAPGHVEPHRLELHQHIPAWQMNDEYMMNHSDEADGDKVPGSLALLHPRHILPKGLPPELRKTWSKYRASKLR